MAETKEYPQRTKVKVNELNAPFLVERIGKAWKGQYGESYPMDVTLADGTLAVVWVNGNSVCGKQVTEGEVESGTAYEVVEAESKSGRSYRAFREV